MVEKRRDNLYFDEDCTFEPVINSKSLFADHSESYIEQRRSRSAIGVTRSMNLYENFYRIEDRKRRLKEDEEIRLKYEQRDPNRRNLKSEAMIQQKKEVALNSIFDQLDGDKDNLLSIRAINIEAVPKEVSRVFLPIVQELEDLDEGEGAIDRNEFI